MNGTDFLLWARGPGFQIAVAIFLLGITFHLVEIFMLGRKRSLSEPRSGEWGPGLRAVAWRMLPERSTFKREPITITAGYIFHIGFFVTLLFFVPHIELFHEWLGLRWPGLPPRLVDIVAAVTIVTLVVVLIHRLANPVRRFLSGPEDYLTWAVTLLPLITGYLVAHRLALPYNALLALHILSVELLMVVFPFTKLMHAFTLFSARWYNGAIAGRRGVVP